MLKSIKAELYKLFKNRTFKVVSDIIVLFSIITIIMSSSVMEKIMMDSLGEMPEDQKQQVINQMINLSDSEAVVTPGQLGIHVTAKEPMNPTALEVYHASFGSGVMEILIGDINRSVSSCVNGQGIFSRNY